MANQKQPENVVDRAKEFLPRHRLHASTYVVLLLTAAVLFLLNVPGLRTANFGIHPYEPWRDRLPEVKTKTGARAVNSKRISTDHLLVHGWPTTWLVREARWYRTTSAGWRATKIWSFREDLWHFDPARLALNIVVGLALLAAAGFVFESWRRRRRHLWQQTIRDWLGFIAVAAAALAVGLKAARDYRNQPSALNAIFPGIDQGWMQGLREAQGQIYQSSGGPIGLRAIFGRRWFARTIQLDVSAKHLQHLASFPHLRALRIEDVRLRDPHLSVLAGLKRLELLRLEQAYPASPPSQNVSGANGDQDVAEMLGFLHRLKHLEVLCLENFAFGDEPARALSALQNLRILVVDDAASLTDDGLAAIAKSENLEILDLTVGNEITADGLRHLASLPHLEFLSLPESIDLKAVEDLQRSMPALKIYVGGEPYVAPQQAAEITRGKDFVQLKNGPFDLDLVFAPDGIEDFDDAWRRRIEAAGFPVCHIDDIIASKEATGLAKDRESLPRLRAFRDYLRKQNR